MPVKPLLQLGHEPWGMFDHISKYPWVLPILEYEDLDDLLANLEQKITAQAVKAIELMPEMMRRFHENLPQ